MPAVFEFEHGHEIAHTNISITQTNFKFYSAICELHLIELN